MKLNLMKTNKRTMMKMRTKMRLQVTPGDYSRKTPSHRSGSYSGKNVYASSLLPKCSASMVH